MPTKPTLDEIRLAHSGHAKWWSGKALTEEERRAITKCNGFDVMGLLLDMIDAQSAPGKA